jgi:DNA polymerase II small subunit/DNA polymerase delta subunit B
MERQEILKEFLSRGSQLDTKSLEFFYQNPSELDNFFEKTKSITLPSIISLEFVQSFSEKDIIKINNKPAERLAKISTDDFVHFLNRRYELINSFFANRLELVNLISINKISPTSKNFSLIVMVKEKDEHNRLLTVEDQTGSIEVLLNKLDQETFKKIVLDETIGITCEKNETIEATSIIWPDVPLKRDFVRTEEDVFCLFISDMHLDDPNFNNQSYEKFMAWFNNTKYEKMYAFVLGNISKDPRQTSEFLKKMSKYTTVYIKTDSEQSPTFDGTILEDNSNITIENGINLLLSTGAAIHKYKHMWPDIPPEQVMLNLLKKRNLNPTIENIQESISSENRFLIDPIPDIFVSGGFHKPGLLNYKGTIILSNSNFLEEPMFWLVNLKSRETLKLNFT